MAAGAALGLLATGAPAQGPRGASERHEGVTITARPWTTPAEYKQKFPKKNPLTGGILAVHVVVQNDTDEALRVHIERIRLLVTIGEDMRQDLPPLSSEYVADTVLRSKPRDPSASRTRLPIPVGKPRASRSKEWVEFEQAVRNAEVPSSVVPPHGKVEGLLYFDVANQLDVGRSGRLYVPEVTAIEKRRSLLYFEIDLSKDSPS